jgi:hypothetical protein
MVEKRQCPNCGSVENSRSHRNGPIEKYFLGPIGVRPYRCLNCDVRFYAFSRFNENASVNNKAA